MPFLNRLATGNHERLAEAFDYQYRHDAIGHKLHVGAGLFLCFFAGWPITWLEVLAGPVYFYGLIRVLNTWRVWAVFWTRALILLIVLWAAWQALTLAWSPNPSEGLNDLGKLRFLAAAWLLWPVMDRRPWLIAALAAGFLCGNAAQLADALAANLGVTWFDWRRPADRHSGWWDPAVAGSLLVGALGLHLPAAFMGGGRTRVMAIAAACVTAAGLLATGTRSGWVAAAALTAITAGVAGVRAVRGGAHRGLTRRAWIVAPCALGAIVGAAALVWPFVGAGVSRRIDEARGEVSRAWSGGDYSTFTGQRILMAKLAIAATAENPVRGVGAGGYRVWTTQRRRAAPVGESPQALARPFPHAHNSLLHAAATSGIAGAILSALVMLVALRGALAREQLAPAGLGSYAAGPGFALLGLALVSAFDTLYVNAQTAALLGILFSMSLLPPPRLPGTAPASPPR
ncbi:MAG: O-antigen ligase family protein [Phycisphaerales bacterium]